MLSSVSGVHLRQYLRSPRLSRSGFLPVSLRWWWYVCSGGHDAKTRPRFSSELAGPQVVCVCVSLHTVFVCAIVCACEQGTVDGGRCGSSNKRSSLNVPSL